MRTELPPDIDVLGISRPPAGDDRDVVEPGRLPGLFALPDLNLHARSPLQRPLMHKGPGSSRWPGPKRPFGPRSLNWRSIVPLPPDEPSAIPVWPRRRSREDVFGPIVGHRVDLDRAGPFRAACCPNDVKAVEGGVVPVHRSPVMRARIEVGFPSRTVARIHERELVSPFRRNRREQERSITHPAEWPDAVVAGREPARQLLHDRLLLGAVRPHLPDARREAAGALRAVREGDPVGA